MFCRRRDWSLLVACTLLLPGCDPAPSSPSRPVKAGQDGDSTDSEGNTPRPRAFGDGTSNIKPAVITAPDPSDNPGDQPPTDDTTDNGATTAEPDGVAPAEPVESPPGDEGPGDAPPRAKAAGLSELFRGWKDPALVLVITGELHGYIEPCGCAGKENQKGGLSRRLTFLEHLRNELNWAVAPLDLGGQVSRFGPQTDIKFHSILDGLRAMHYDAIALGPDDLRLPEGELLAEQGTFVSANVDVLAPLPRSVVVERGGRKIGVTAVFGDAYRKQVNNDALQFQPAEDSLQAVVADLKEQQCDFLVLLSHAPRDESLALARRYPEFNVVVTAGGADEPPFQPARVDDTDQWMVEAGHKGMYVSVVGLFDNPEQPLRYERVPLDSRFMDAEEMTQLMANYQEQLKTLGLGGLDVRSQPHPSGRKFVGSQACGSCHTKAMQVFEQTPHAHALDTLVNLNPPRHYDPECLSCHATGWEPQKFFPFKGGYLDLEQTAHLQHNGCENCHGPGSAHVAVESGDQPATDSERDALREELRLTLDLAEKKCLECHDLDNSPDFNFNDPDNKNHPNLYWPKVEHHGKD